MISFFRKIRQKLLSQNRVTRYLAYAMGEIILVTIGILIALQINTANQQRIEKKEKSILVGLLNEELKENLAEFKLKVDYLENCRKKNIQILKIASGIDSGFPIDSTRKYAFEMLPIFTTTIKSSRLTSSKEAGKFNLLNEEESKALTDYETSLLLFQESRLLTNVVFTEDGNELMVRFSLFKTLNPLVFEGEEFPEHPQLILDDKELVPYLKLPDTYRLIHRNYNNIFTQILWLNDLESITNSTLAILEKENHD